ncbi:MAG TPA: GTPase HflX [Verrucomicrobiae bacterium]|nr:GTPase HflX [Verrucomicrobiae bacterium]
MHEIQEPSRESALLIGLERPGHDRWAVKDSLEELRELAVSAGAEVLDVISQKRDSPAAATFIGTGKVEELAAKCRDTGANLVIFDDDLSPAQGRNLSEILGLNVKVIDRTELILDIFAQRARTREGKIQVELAQLHYMLPRLAGLWTHLSRQRGGVGSRGPGEQQLEVDRRRVQEKIHRLEDALDEVRKNRRVERGGRQRLHWPLVSIIGYTNSGKSTLMNKLTGAGVLAEDKLFATLDPTARKLRLPNNQNILLSDTVGFLRKLPHHLIDSFKATLEEVVEADLLLHVVDASHPHAHEQIKAVEIVLKELDAWGKSTVVALNKIDKLENGAAVLEGFQREFDRSVPMSAKTGENLDALRDEIANRLSDRRVDVTLSIPQDRAKTIALVYRSGYVTAREMENGNVVLRAQIPKVLAGELTPYVVDESK